MENINGMHQLVGLQIFWSGTPTFSMGTPTFCQMGAACPLIFLFGGTCTPWCFHLGYMFIFEGTHILELFFHSKRIEAMKSDHLDVYNSDIIML